MRLIFNKYEFSAALIFFCLFVTSFQTNAQTRETERAAPLNLWANASVAGVWRINYAESENALVKVQTLLKNQLDQAAAAQNTENKPTITISLFPPETLVLADENDKAMTTNEGFNNVILTRTVLMNGKAQIGEIEGGNFIITAKQIKNQWLVETVSPRGNILTETFELRNEGRKLNVTVKVEDAAHKELITAPTA